MTPSAAASTVETAPFRLPIAGTAAALLALGALWHAAGGSLFLPFLALALIGPHLTSYRVGGGWWTPWLLRILVFTAVALAVANAGASAYDGIIDPRATNLFGHLCAAELVVQVWRKHPAMGPQGSGALLLTGLILIAAGNTFDLRGMAVFGPAFLLLVVAALPGFYPTREGKPFRPGGLSAGFIVLLLLAMGIGGSVHLGLLRNRQALLDWSNRVAAPLLNKALSRFGMSPQLGESFDLQLSPTRVMLIEGLQDTAHLRGVSFDSYQMGRWTPSITEHSFLELAPGLLRPDVGGPQATVTRLADDYQLLFVPLDAAGIAPAADSELEWAPEHGFALRAHRRDLNPYLYSFSQPLQPNHQGPLCAPLQGIQRQRLLLLPPNARAVLQAYASRLAEGETRPLELVRRVETFLMSNNSYSLRVRPGRGEPIVDFLQNQRAAHCQYFASSAAMLLRAMGIPARYVSGYLAHERDERGRTVVRQRDAHAWTEAYLDGIGWVTVDATPGGGRPDQLWGDVPFWIEYWEKLQDAVLSLRDRLANGLGIDGKVLLALIPLGIVVVAVILLRRRRRGTGPNGAYSLPGPEWGALAERFNIVLEERGAPCPPSLPWELHLQHLETALAAAEPPPGGSLVSAAFLGGAKAFVAEYNRARFGPPGDPEVVARLQRQLNTLKAAPR